MRLTLWDEARTQHRVLNALLFAISVWRRSNNFPNNYDAMKMQDKLTMAKNTVFPAMTGLLLMRLIFFSTSYS